MSRHEAKDGKDEAAGVETPDGKGASPDPIRSEACSFLRLYAQADALDRCALALGVLGAAINAPTMPVFAYVFGEVRSAVSAPRLARSDCAHGCGARAREIDVPFGAARPRPTPPRHGGHRTREHAQRFEPATHHPTRTRTVAAREHRRAFALYYYTERLRVRTT